MTFYSSISRFYDEIFPADADEMNFVKQRLAGYRRILDIGCGTGNKTIHLASPGCDIVAIDSDPAMIEAAKKKHHAPNVDYRLLNMRDIGRAFGLEAFDALLCLGNTLVHLPSQDDIAALLADMAAILRPGGLAVIQILNYDRILDKRLFTLPALETANVRFERHYEFSDCEMKFVTRLVVKQNGQALNSSIPLYPLRKRELDAMLGEAGFLEAAHFGSYRGDPLTGESFPLIALARKA